MRTKHKRINTLSHYLNTARQHGIILASQEHLLTYLADTYATTPIPLCELGRRVGMSKTVVYDWLKFQGVQRHQHGGKRGKTQ